MNRNLKEYCNIKRRTHTLEVVKKAKKKGCYQRRKLDDSRFEDEMMLN